MTNWEYKIEMKDINKDYEEEKITFIELIDKVSEKITIFVNENKTKLDDLNEDIAEELEELIEGLDDLSEEDEPSMERYNEILAELYLIADDYNIWISSL